MSGMSGSATADAAGIGSIMIPSLIRAGFSRRTAAALTASAATLGPIIPPSVAMVLYASLANVSLGRLLLAGFLPGLVIGLFLMIDLWLSGKAAAWRGCGSTGGVSGTARDAILALIMPAIILGGMFGGIYTPTEGAAVAVAYALVIGVVVYRTLNAAAIFRALRDRRGRRGGPLRGGDGERGLVHPDRRAGRRGAPTGVPAVPGLAADHHAPHRGDDARARDGDGETTMLVLMTPMLAPIVAQAGIDPIHFGLVFVLATMIGLITPPVGITMFITCQLAGITVNEFTRAVWRPFLALVLAVIVCALWRGWSCSCRTS